MKTFIKITTIFLLSASAFLPARTSAQSSATSISFQGALNGPGGVPLPNGSYTLRFQFWDDPTSTAAGNAVSTNIPLANVTVAGGVASTALPVDPVWFNGQTRYLGVSVNGGPELSPRVLVTAVPYALEAVNARGVSQSNMTQGPRLSQNRLVLGSEAQGDSSFVVQLDNPNSPQARVVLQAIHSAGNAWADLYVNPGGGTVYSGPRFIVGSDSLGQSALDIAIVATDTEIQAIRSAGSAWGHVFINKNGGNVIINRNAGNVGIGTENAEAKLTVNGTTRTTVLQITSARAAKEGFASIDAAAVLAKVAALPIATWVYTNRPGDRHLGPVAEDFHATFALGEDDKHIATVDADGVLFASVQAIHQLMQEKDARIAALEKELAAAKADFSTRLARLEKSNAWWRWRSAGLQCAARRHRRTLRKTRAPSPCPPRCGLQVRAPSLPSAALHSRPRSTQPCHQPSTTNSHT
jgi:hypothetical protein